MEKQVLVKTIHINGLNIDLPQQACVKKTIHGV